MESGLICQLSIFIDMNLATKSYMVVCYIYLL